RIKFIKRAQQLGFSLSEVEDLLRMRDDPRARDREIRALAAAKLRDIDEKIRHLSAMRKALATLLRPSRSSSGSVVVPIFEALDPQDEGATGTFRGGDAARSPQGKERSLKAGRR